MTPSNFFVNGANGEKPGSNDRMMHCQKCAGIDIELLGLIRKKAVASAAFRKSQ